MFTTTYNNVSLNDGYNAPGRAHFSHRPIFMRHPVLMIMMFFAAYFTTITVKAQDTLVTGDAIQLQSNEKSLMTGTIKEVKDDYFVMVSGEKELRVSLRDVEMTGPADAIFTPGMKVSVRGDLKGEEFGQMLVRAKSVVASEGTATTFIEDKSSRHVD